MHKVIIGVGEESLQTPLDLIVTCRCQDLGDESKRPNGARGRMGAANTLILLILIIERVLIGKHEGAGVAVNLVLETHKT